MIEDHELDKLLSLVKDLSKEAERIKKTDFKYSYKADSSPLSEADSLLNTEIAKFLQSTKIKNIISEENKIVPYSERKKWEYYWVVDPIDGTKEYINKNDDYTINIALCNASEIVLGIVAKPATNDIYLGIHNQGSFKNNQKISSNKILENKVRVVASKSHLNEQTKKILDALQQIYDIEIISIGSSLKICLLAENKADLYPRFGPTMEWDTCAANIILDEASGNIYDYNGSKLSYNKYDLTNPHFLACSEAINFEEIKYYMERI